MKKVLILVNHDVWLYSLRLELIERLLKEQYEVWISCPYGQRIDDLQAMGCRYVPSDLERHGVNPLAELKLIGYYKRIIKEICPDIVFSYTIKPNLYGAIACRACGVPLVANITGLGTALENGGLSQKFLILLYKFAFTKVQTVFFQNRENRAFFEKHKIALGKHKLLPGSGVNLTKFSPLEYPDEETVEFGFIARIMKEKGIDQYLEAAKAIREKYPQTRFHICGFCEPEYDGKLQEYVENGSVIYHGMVRDVREIYKRLHCVVHPTYYPEGMSNILLEACASARAIITTDRSGCREILEDGINGFLVKQKDSEDLAAQLERFIELPYEKKRAMGLAGRVKVEKEFDRQIVVEKYLKEMEDLQCRFGNEEHS